MGLSVEIIIRLITETTGMLKYLHRRYGIFIFLNFTQQWFRLTNHGILSHRQVVTVCTNGIGRHYQFKIIIKRLG